PNMKILGIDYGRKKIGLSFSEGKIASPLGVIKFEDWKSFKERLIEIIAEEGVEKIVIGVSEGKMAEEIKKFGERLLSEISAPIEYFDETLSTHQAQELSRESGMKKNKRLALEDAYAASVMLQSYLDNNV
ncbi:MAG: hypothetical protein US96_C0041G0005, partial [Candidatus Woesebacteria bacterium GW2011_GWB1_38_5b]